MIAFGIGFAIFFLIMKLAGLGIGVSFFVGCLGGGWFKIMAIIKAAGDKRKAFEAERAREKTQETLAKLQKRKQEIAEMEAQAKAKAEAEARARAEAKAKAEADIRAAHLAKYNAGKACFKQGDYKNAFVNFRATYENTNVINREDSNVKEIKELMVDAFDMLMELREYDFVINDCDEALKNNKKAIEIYQELEARGQNANFETKINLFFIRYDIMEFLAAAYFKAGDENQASKVHENAQKQLEVTNKMIEEYEERVKREERKSKEGPRGFMYRGLDDDEYERQLAESARRENTIASAKQNGDKVSVYNLNGKEMFWPKTGELVGFTADAVSIKVNDRVYVYDSKGNEKFWK